MADDFLMQAIILRRERCRMLLDSSQRDREDPDAQTSTTHRIQKVAFLLRENENSRASYEPRLVSFGPIHHGKEKYQLAEKLKLRLAKEFVESSGKTIEEICDAIDGKIEELRKCFEEEVTEKYKDVDLAWILVVDGCAILQYIYLAVTVKLKELNIKQDSVAFFRQDLFLLENQVPYDLLALLMGLSNVGNKLRNSIEEFIKMNHDCMVPMVDESFYPQSGKQPENRKRKPTHLLDLLRSSLLGPERESRLNIYFSSDWKSLHELKAAGIHVKRSKDNSFRGIYFNRKLNFYPGFLSLPRLNVDYSTRPILLNLIAYENCQDFENDFGITSYVSLLDSLIDEANDVKELRKARVLFNFLGSDKEVARLFNEIGTELASNSDLYIEVKMQIQKYCDNPWMTWIAEFLQNYFSSPWTVLASFGILLALALSATQTWYTVHSPPGPCDDFCNKFKGNL